MEDKRIYSLARKFRELIIRAKEKGYFTNTKFQQFPEQCCGDASFLLAQFFLDENISTLWVSGQEDNTYETHAWLVIDDQRVSLPQCCINEIPNSIVDLYGTYGGYNADTLRKKVRYDADDIECGLIVDITGDQFGEESVYVGYMDDFHSRFAFHEAIQFEGLSDPMLVELYAVILNQ